MINYQCHRIFYLLSLLLVSLIQPGFCQSDEIDSVYTPKESRVYAWRTFEAQSSLRDTMDNAALRAYPENTYFTTYDNKSSTRKFNCHGYAWYMSESGLGLSDPRWIGHDSITEEDIYMTDGSYVQVASEMYPGKVSWGGLGSDHSAITTPQTGIFISKWGFGPFAKHAYDNSPYWAVNLKYYVATKINGSTDLLCQLASRNFSAANIPNASYNWVVGNGLSKTENGNSVTVTANYGFSGETYIEVTITSPIGGNQNDIKTSKRVYFEIGGVPSAPTVYPSGDPFVEMGIYSYKDIVVTNYPGEASWSSSGSVQTIWAEGQTGRFYSTAEGNAYFYVITSNVCGSSPMYQGTIKVIGDMMDSTDPNDKDSSWLISPNPCNTFFDICYTPTDNSLIDNPYSLEIYDSNSRLKYTKTLTGSKNRILIKDLFSGAYFVLIRSEGKAIWKSLIVQ